MHGVHLLCNGTNRIQFMLVDSDTDESALDVLIDADLLKKPGHSIVEGEMHMVPLCHCFKSMNVLTRQASTRLRFRPRTIIYKGQPSNSRFLILPLRSR